jgi:hypothetical protein
MILPVSRAIDCWFGLERAAHAVNEDADLGERLLCCLFASLGSTIIRMWCLLANNHAVFWGGRLKMGLQRAAEATRRSQRYAAVGIDEDVDARIES